MEERNGPASPLAVTGLVLAYIWVNLVAVFALYLVWPVPGAVLVPPAVTALITMNVRGHRIRAARRQP